MNAKTGTRSDVDMLHEIETAHGGAGPDPIETSSSPALRELGAAAELHERAAAETLTAVRHARAEGLSWTVIGAILGVSRQAARQRFEPLM